MLPANPALRLLFVLKLRGALRMQVRRMRKPLNWLLFALGGGLFALWLGAAFLGRGGGGAGMLAPQVLQLAIELGLFALLALTIVSAFQHRGLYLPKDEIELAFSAPLERTDLVRYRLLSVLSRSLLAALFFGLLAARRMPGPLWAFLGTICALLTVPLVGQLVALFLGDAENRLARVARRLPLRAISLGIGIAAGAGLAWALVADAADQVDMVPALQSDAELEPAHERDTLIASIAKHPVVRLATVPVAPWARMVTAGSASEFLPWFVLALGAWLALYGVLTRISIDFRELSLETSADVARRIRQARRSGWSSGAAPGVRAGPMRAAPWLFGRGDFGAVAWLETASLMRRARGTIVLSIGVVALLTALSATLTLRMAESGQEGREHALALSVGMIFLLGTVYLCSGLRFDFRARLDHMELVKSWPLASWRLFLATILPETLLVTAILWFAMIARAAWMGVFHPVLLAALAFQPLFVLTWVALDNAVFLRAPVRYAPGQESTLQHVGRSVVLFLVRLALLALSTVVAVLPAAAVGFGLRKFFDAPDAVAITAAAMTAWVGVLVVDAILVWFGGKMLQRYELGSER